jgi:hypothetical protein
LIEDFMAEGLFDNRYRYDYIYPRGRSGETLRAVDTADNDRLVVIKRPAPNDAPPIRAGQEVSILNERKALTRLAGHPVLTALLGGGQFLVGGVAHQYIVMERGQGVIVADLVHELAGRDERMAELEMLVIVDSLLDLLQMAHTRDIVYNDVDAKHLFWDRENYRLKVIDWGNAVFLEGDEITPQGVSRQNDIFQAGELLYFILTGGSRIDVPRDAGEDFLLDFGRDAERVSPRLQAIVSKAAHPNAKLRYRSINDLRRALAEYREPIERERNTILGRVVERLRHNRSKDELQGLLEMLQPALAMDPGYPQARAAYREIMARLHDLEVGADLDAARIYMESANWSRAVDLLDELRGRAQADMRALIDMLLDLARLLIDAKVQPTPRPVLDAMTLIFERQPVRAARLLVMQDPGDDRARALQWLLAERISAHTPDVLLLRPNLYRLSTALAALAAEGVPVTEPRAVLAEIDATLDRISNSSSASLIELRDGYRAVVDGLTALGALLEALNSRHNLPDRRLPVSALDRALTAAMALADNMHVIGRQATTSPRDALNALDNSRGIDPTSPAWDAVARMLNALYELLGSYQTYVPSADGSDLGEWLVNARRDLLPFTERLYDDMLVGMCEGLEAAARAWEAYDEYAVEGNRLAVITTLAEAIDAVGTVSPTLSGWLNQLRTVVTNSTYVERHALYGGLGRALADGWDAFDRGRLSDAERLGQQAFEISRTDGQRFAAERLRSLAEVARAWADRSSVNNLKGTQAALTTVEELYTADENTVRTNFAAQMPSKETYLKAMGKGLVELYSRSSTAAPRILFFNYILLGTLDAHEGALEDADFWREAAVKTLGDAGSRHLLTRALADFVERRRDIEAGVALLNSLNNREAMAEVDKARKRLEDNPQARTLAAGIQSLRELEGALRGWNDGEFKAAGLKLENAYHAAEELGIAAVADLSAYKSWLMELQSGAAELHNQSRLMLASIEARPDKPDDIIGTAYHRMVDLTTRLLGEPYVAVMRGWRDTYESFLAVYIDNTIRRSEKLNRFNQLFRAMFIDRHPAYPLYRHWYEVTEHAPEFPAPPTDEPVPQIRDEAVTESEYVGSRYLEGPERRPVVPRPSRRMVFLGVIAVGVLAVLAVLSSLLNRPVPADPVATATQFEDASTALTPGNSIAAAPSQPPSDTPVIATNTVPASTLVTPSLVPTPLPIGDVPTSSPGITIPPPPSLTEEQPTPTPSNTLPPTATPTRTPTPPPTLPPGGLQGQQNLLDDFSAATGLPWNPEHFTLVKTINTSYWRLGARADDPGGEYIVIAPDANWLNTSYGGDAATRIRRMEAEMTLLTYSPSLLDAKQVYFGALLLRAGNPASSAGINVQLAQPDVVNIGQRTGDNVKGVSQRKTNAIVARIRLDRDVKTGAVTAYFNGEPLGAPMSLGKGDEALLPALFVRKGDVVVSVTNWTVTLR